MGQQTRILLLAVWAAGFWPNALYSESRTTNKIDGTTVEFGGPYTLGDSGPFNFLIVTNGGALTNTLGTIGNTGSASNNVALVVGTNSLWKNNGDLIIGYSGSGNSLHIDAGGRVGSASALLGLEPTSSSNEVLIAGTASSWVSASLVVGDRGSGNRFVINGGTAVVLTNVDVGRSSSTSSNNCLRVSRGSLNVGNPFPLANLYPQGLVTVRGGKLIVDGGTLTADNVSVEGETLLFTRGTINAGIVQIAFPQLLTVGDGTNSAILRLGGGFWGAGLNIARHSTLIGSGNEISPTTNAGTISADSPWWSSLIFYPGLHLLDSSKVFLQIGGTNVGADYGFIFGSNYMVLGGNLSVALKNNFVPRPNDRFVPIGGQLQGAFANAGPNSRLKTTDNLGSFLVEYASFWVTLTDYRSTDTDGDGVEDSWANQYLGHSPLTIADKLADKDGDGASNYDEFVAGTNPEDAASVFKITSTARGDDDAVVLQFRCLETKTYRIWFSDNLAVWNEVPDPLFAFPAPGVCRWMDERFQTLPMLEASRYYRVSVE